MKNIRILLFVSILFFGCKNSTTLLEEVSEFKGITVTDTLGNVLILDSDDWNGNTKHNPQFPRTTGFEPAFPNSTTDSITIRFSIAKVYNLKVWIIDTNIKELIVFYNNSALNAGTYDIKWDLKDKNDIKLSSGIYRCLYTISEIDSINTIAIEGHGDIQINL
jgi:hypothetical protein